jgi:hypothetical protein
VRFAIPERLIAELRQHRSARRALRPPSSPAATAPDDASFLQRVAGLVQSSGADAATVAAAVAANYAAAMFRWEDELESAHDAFLLDPGMGPMLYLTADGRVLIDGRGWDGEPLREATDDEATVALVVGAKKTGIAGLFDLLPPRPPEGSSCPTCRGARVERLPATDPERPPPELVCSACKGRGWTPGR